MATRIRQLPPATRRATLWVLALLFFGLLAIITISEVTTNLVADLDRRSSNERARLAIGEHIVDGVRSIESSFFQLATANATSRTRLARQIDHDARELVGSIDVLRSGGSVKKRLALNIEGQDEMIREFHYRPDLREPGAVLEVIEITPLVEQIHPRALQLTELLDQRDTCNGHRLYRKHRRRPDTAVQIDPVLLLSPQRKRQPAFPRRLHQSAATGRQARPGTGNAASPAVPAVCADRAARHRPELAFPRHYPQHPAETACRQGSGRGRKRRQVGLPGQYEP